MFILLVNQEKSFFTSEINYISAQVWLSKLKKKRNEENKEPSVASEHAGIFFSTSSFFIYLLFSTLTFSHIFKDCISAVQTDEDWT